MFLHNNATWARIISLSRPKGWGGGGGILPVATLDVNNFFNIKANATKLGDLSGNDLI